MKNENNKKKYDRSKHYFKCGYCGYIGLESELEEDPNNQCGRDKCPDCEMEYFISGSYETYDEADEYKIKSD